jgi:hypothetical protein
MDFPIADNSKDQFAVHYWNGKEWIQISQGPERAKVSQALSTNADHELCSTETSTNICYQILTTDKIAIFVLGKQ